MELTDITGVHRTNPAPPMFCFIALGAWPYLDDFAANSRKSTANPPSSTTADPGSTCSAVPSPPYPRSSWDGPGPALDQTACA